MKYFVLFALCLGQVVHAEVAAQSAGQPSPASDRPPLNQPNRGADQQKFGLSMSDVFKSKYAEYLVTVEKTVQARWYRILNEQQLAPRHGSRVDVTFKINSRGEADVVKVEDFEAGKPGVIACINAIQTSQPYGKWTKPMIADLGEEQTLTFSFEYQ